jgi:NAD(P)-dependent dehydrogenase (short-subunit alcohol dehydrogenase family)
MRLQDKVIIVTGSTTGIGEAIARRCVAEGAKVLVNGRDEERAQQLVAELGNNTAYHIDDLADAGAAQRIVEAAVQAFGRLDGLVNNAAFIVRSTLATTDAALFDQVMAVNVRAPLLLMKTAVPHLKASQGSVVNIGSVNAYTGEPKLLAYSISKGALMTMSRNLANVLAVEKVRVNHLNVGWVITPNEYKIKLGEGLPENWPEKLGPDNIPSGRMTQPEEIAAHVAFWLSDDSRPISGSVLELEQYPIIGRIPLKEGDASNQ